MKAFTPVILSRLLFTRVPNPAIVATALAAVSSLGLLTGTAQANTVSSSTQTHVNTNANTNVNTNANDEQAKVRALTLDVLEQQQNTQRSSGSHYASVQGYIDTVMTGSDSNYGMRFWVCASGYALLA